MAAASLAGCGSLTGGVAGRSVMPSTPLVQGVVWQPDAATLKPRGKWELLGASELLVQWSAVDGLSLLEPDADAGPDWSRIAKEPWASRIVMGLAGRYQEAVARRDVEALVNESLALARRRWPVPVAGWYFPLEVDPSWAGAAALAGLLAELPRPLWISAYDGGNIGPQPFADWAAGWLPADVGLFFQDGVGLEMREPRVARAYADALRQRLGSSRLKVIAEAFRPAPAGGRLPFRAATAAELLPQLQAYKNLPVFLFDGPHYVPDDLVEAVRWLA